MYSEVKRGSVENRQLLIDSLDSVFRPGNVQGSSMALEFPHLFSDDNIENTFYIDDGKIPVSQASVLLSKTCINGAILDVASLGSVSTMKDHRHKGLSTKIINRMIEVYRNSEIDLLLVSGEIELYTKLGCVKTGSDYSAVIEKIGKNEDIEQNGKYFVKLSSPEERIANAVEYHRIHIKEKFRYMRTSKEFSILLNALWFKRNGFRMDLFEIRNENETILAYVVAFKKIGDSKLKIMEYAGSRKAIASCLLDIMAKMECSEIRFRVNEEDFNFIEELSRLNVKLVQENSQGTLKILNSQSIFRKLRPLIIERIGEYFEFREIGNEKWLFISGSLKKEINGYDDLTHFIFDKKEGSLGIPLMFTDDLNYI
ncbi:GNAT family N-acetyltransferase [Cuniculiplasma divulgatum]|jgi:hypothetical protein|uniref:GNAT family N-acetyltransferase n=1 Tax=Cuniculiplasma divulgatum TaxID=1673428 RepID=A0A1N5W7V6_9ARCH|nr:GNAT family N-acetyltransferase [Cuniculiplasma divulgatum]MCI2412682.1 GNAT family N-acetyltransferase [Cuniculiplasma sp.]OWP55436.1 MAG: hypothetical protein B2I18_01620 [Cuniculiplasma sp. C_DKE]SIM81069.1 GNAT family N-acetyltransferase [Cuniculiplasma divulgatum]SJK85450.1 GNAT family N-acetyltransferase [Cuniculiplasma divulgatum]